LSFLLGGFVLRFTTFGRYVYAVGGNERSARTSGIRTRLVVFGVYVISGTLAALAGLILAARTTSALPQAGVAYELDAIAAVVIGGTSLSGGVGTLTGTLFGALIIGVINNGLDLLGVSSYYQQVTKGAIIVAAVLLDATRMKRG
jgi:putative xylitol transport system permease protein